jgi:hypothetical protein
VGLGDARRLRSVIAHAVLALARCGHVDIIASARPVRSGGFPPTCNMITHASDARARMAWTLPYAVCSVFKEEAEDVGASSWPTKGARPTPSPPPAPFEMISFRSIAGGSARALRLSCTSTGRTATCRQLPGDEALK